MKAGSRRTIHCVMGTMVVCLLGVAMAGGQAVPAEKPLLSEEAFKNVQVLRGIPVKEFMGTMGFFAASLSLNCTDCHVSESGSDWARYADDTPLKQTARRMVLMMNAINKANFAGARGGGREVTCYTCHRGSETPDFIPSLAEQYGTPPPGDPDTVEILGAAPAGLSADQILDKYIQALGGANRLASLTSFVGKGTYSGYDTDLGKVPFEVFAKAPGQRTTIAHSFNGDLTTTYDGREAWIAAPATNAPVPVLSLSGGDLDGARMDAELSFPGRIKQDLSGWRVGFPATTVNDKAVQIVEGTTASGTPVKLYFDKQSGLLVRQVRYTNTMVGIIPTHIEYSDYREVSGVKIPFHWVVTWTDGQATIELSAVQANVPIDAAKFGKPAAPVTKAPAQ